MAVALQNKRSAQSEMLMRHAIRESDPLCDGNSQDVSEVPLPAGSRKRLHDSIDKVIKVEVDLDDGSSQEVLVASAPYYRDYLKVELTPEAMALLTKTPRQVVAAPSPCTPIIKQPHVVYKSSRMICEAKYYDSEAQKVRTKSLHVKHSTNSDTFQANVDAVAKALEDVFMARHTFGVLPKLDKGRAAADDQADTS
eukprot:7177594-Pyramimonas_sp.AAC.1